MLIVFGVCCIDMQIKAVCYGHCGYYWIGQVNINTNQRVGTLLSESKSSTKYTMSLEQSDAYKFMHLNHVTCIANFYA